jgi:catechol 2,3-dioxygenase-like lactoylglutathione lyase family enzyme
MTAGEVRILGLDHVQLAIPPGGENAARAFYVGLVGLAEVAKPAALAGRGGLWLEGGTLKLHLGVEARFQPARKAHPGILVAGLATLAARLSAAGVHITIDASIPATERFHCTDPFGNRLEFMAMRKDD